MKINLEKITKKCFLFSKEEPSLLFWKKPLCDSVELTKATKKTNTAIKLSKNPVLACLSSLKINKVLIANHKISVEEYKKIGGSFYKGKAFVGKRPFSGKMVKEANGQEYVITYKNGLLKEVNINPDKFGYGKIVKRYEYNGQDKLTQITSESQKPNDDIDVFLDKLPKTTRFLAPIDMFYKRKPLSKTTIGDDFAKRVMYDFSLTPEGIRRSKMSDEEISKEVIAIFKDTFKKRGIDESLYPNLKIFNKNTGEGGSYEAKNHTLKINIGAYRNGLFELIDCIEHEALHCEQSLLRASLPRSKRNEIIKNALLDRIGKSETSEVVYGIDIFGDSLTVKTPKMSEKMIEEFKNFITSDLRFDDRKSINDLRSLFADKLDDDQEKLLKKIKKLIKYNPDFLRQYEGQNEATKALIKYSLSHLVRFEAISNAVSKNLDIPTIELDSLQAQKAIDSLIGFIETLEGNARISKGNKGSLAGVGKDAFDNYQFSQEEVLAQIQGNNALIISLLEKMKKMQIEGKLSEVQRINFENMITQAQKTIEFKTKGMEWYRKTIELSYNPDDEKIKKQVEKMRSQLDILEEQTKIKEYVVGMARGTKHRN